MSLNSSHPEVLRALIYTAYNFENNDELGFRDFENVQKKSSQAEYGVYEKFWVIINKPMHHPNCDRAAFFNTQGKHSSFAKKAQAVKMYIESIGHLDQLNASYNHLNYRDIQFHMRHIILEFKNMNLDEGFEKFKYIQDKYPEVEQEVYSTLEKICKVDSIRRKLLKIEEIKDGKNLFFDRTERPRLHFKRLKACKAVLNNHAENFSAKVKANSFEYTNSIPENSLLNHQDKVILIQKWITDDNEVSIFLRGKKLESTIFYHKTGESQIVPISEEGHEVEEVINFLRGCDVKITEGNTNFSPLFYPNYWPCSIAPANFSNGEIGLLYNGSDYIWRFFDKNTNTASWIYADLNNKILQEYIDGAPEEDCSDYLKDFRIHIQVEKTKNYSKLSGVSLSKVIESSQVDSTGKVLLDRDNWALTLISGGYSSIYDTAKPLKKLGLIQNNSKIGLIKDNQFGHAMIAIEGIKKGKRFLHYAHLTTAPTHPKFPNKKSNEAEVELLKDENLMKSHFQTPTWPLKRINVEKMIESIEKDQNKPILFVSSGNFLLSSEPIIGLSKEWILGVQMMFRMPELWYWWVKAVTTGCIEKPEETSQHENESILKKFDNYMIKKFYKDFLENEDLISHEDDVFTNCLIWSLKKLNAAGIELPEPVIGIPNSYIKSVALQPSKSIKH